MHRTRLVLATLWLLLSLSAACSTVSPEAAPTAVATASPAPSTATPESRAVAPKSTTRLPSPTSVAAVTTASSGPVAVAPSATASPAAPRPTVSVLPTNPTATAKPSRPDTLTAVPRLFLTVVEPSAETVEVPSSTKQVVVTGKSQPSAVVSVNGQLLPLDDSGSFRTEVILEDEITLVEVVASDATGSEVRAQRVIVRD